MAAVDDAFTTTLHASISAGTPAGPGGGDAASELVGELQRLAVMHRVGELTDEEFASAKQRLLRAT